MRIRATLQAIALLILTGGVPAHSQTMTASATSGVSPSSIQVMMDQPRPLAEVLGAFFAADGKIQLATGNLLVSVTDGVDAIPLLGDPVGAYFSSGPDGAVAVQVSAFGETQSLPIPADFSGMHGIPLAPRTQVQRLASSKDSQVLALLVHGYAPSPYFLLVVDGVHFTKLAEFTLSEDDPAFVRVSSDGGTIVVGYVNGLARLWNVSNKFELPSIHTLPANPTAGPMIGADFLKALCVSPNGSHVFLAQADLRGQILDRNGQSQPIVIQLPGDAGNCAFDPEGKKIAVGASSSELLLGLDGKSIWSKNDAASPTSYVAFREDGKELLFVDQNGAHVRHIESGDVALYFTAYKSSPQADWTAWSPSGRFDGSQEGMRHLRYASAGGTGAPLPIDALMRDYYTPGLVGSVLHMNISAPVSAGVPASSSQTVKLRAEGAPGQSVNVAVSITDSEKKGHASVRLFRNRQLVKRWQGVDLANSTGTASLTATIALLPGKNHLLAYSYDDRGIKSADAVIDCVGPRTAEPGTLHVLSVGINHYQSNPGTSLNWAEADANLMAQVLFAQRTQIDREETEMSSHPEMKYSQQDREKFGRAAGPVNVTVLLSDQATRKNIQSAFSQIAAKAKPQDTVVLFFAGHGTNRSNTFYFLTSDMPAFETKYTLDTVPEALLSQGAISDRDLETAIEPIDAETIAVIFDACDSGQLLLASTDVRRGALDAQGFAQLAFEKGISLLAAAPSSQEAKEGSEAKESSKFAHGWLTYVLGFEGLQYGNARVSDMNASIYLDALFRYAAQEVPKYIAQKPTMYLPNRSEADRTLIGFGAVVLDPNSGQIFQGAGNSPPPHPDDTQSRQSLGDLTPQTKDAHPALITSVSFEDNQLVVTLARNSSLEQTIWGGSEPIHKTLALDWTQLDLNSQAPIVTLRTDGRYVGVDPAKLATFPLPEGWKSEARIFVRKGIPIGVVQSSDNSPAGSLEAWDISKSELLWSKPNPYLGSSAISADGMLLALNMGRKIQLVQADNGNTRWPPVDLSYVAPLDSFQASAFSEDGTLLATSTIGANTDIQVWNLSATPSNRMIWMTRPHDTVAELMFFSDQSRRNLIAAALADGTISVYQWQPEAPSEQFISGGQAVSVLALSADGTIIAAGTNDGVVSLFDLKQHAMVLRLRWIENAGAWVAQDDAGHFDAPRSLWGQLSWSHDGKTNALKPGEYTESLATKVLQSLLNRH